MTADNTLQKHARLSTFFTQMRPKVTGFLCKKYHLSEDEAADCFQEGTIAMWKNLKEGKVTLEAIQSLESYLFRCCCNHAAKALLHQTRISTLDDIGPNAEADDEPADSGEERERQIDVLVALVKRLDEPCHSIIWGHYRHHYTMEEMAAMLRYKNADVVKAKKNSCMRKLKEFARQRGLINPQNA